LNEYILEIAVRDAPNMGWPRLVGSLKLQVSFAKEPYERYSAKKTNNFKEPTTRRHPIAIRNALPK